MHHIRTYASTAAVMEGRAPKCVWKVASASTPSSSLRQCSKSYLFVGVCVLLYVCGWMSCDLGSSEADVVACVEG